MKQQEHFFSAQSKQKQQLYSTSILENIRWMQDDNSHNSDFFMKILNDFHAIAT